MSTAYQRRRDPQPTARGWEIALIALGGLLVAVGFAALVGVAVASSLWGGGWVWPHGTEAAVHQLGGLLHGDPGRGLPPDQLHRVAAPFPVYAGVVAAECGLAAMGTTVAVVFARYRRPDDARGGMATRREAAHALGLRRLRAARTVIRPDRYPSPGRSPVSTGGTSRADAVHRSAPPPGADADLGSPFHPTATTTKETPA